MQNTVKIENVKENVEKLVKTIVNEAISDLNEENASDYSYSLNDIEITFNDNETATIEISVDYTIHFYEISEAVSNMIEYLLSDREVELNEEELEKLYNETYNEELERINSEYMIPLDLEATLDLESYYIGGGKLKVKASPVSCDSDYCDTGLWIVVRLEEIPIESLIKASNDIKITVKSVIERVAEFHRI